MKEKTPDVRPCYFLTLEVENVACFGSRQTLSFRDKDGKPARWTVILGNNAIGKTTLLKKYLEKEKPTDVLFVNGDDIIARQYLESQSINKLRDFVLDRLYRLLDVALRTIGL